LEWSPTSIILKKGDEKGGEGESLGVGVGKGDEGEGREKGRIWMVKWTGEK
jgi:hypothetical protein